MITREFWFFYCLRWLCEFGCVVCVCVCGCAVNWISRANRVYIIGMSVANQKNAPTERWMAKATITANQRQPRRTKINWIERNDVSTWVCVGFDDGAADTEEWCIKRGRDWFHWSTQWHFHSFEWLRCVWVCVCSLLIQLNSSQVVSARCMNRNCNRMSYKRETTQWKLDVSRIQKKNVCSIIQAVSSISVCVCLNVAHFTCKTCANHSTTFW